jgi:uncharacterized membrane protein YbhN (UPF0104 family)
MVAVAWRSAGARIQVGRTASELHFFWLGMALIALNVGQVVAALRLQFTLSALGRQAAFTAVLRAHFIGLWFNQALPTGIGGDVAKVMLLRKPGDLLRCARGVLLTRIVGLAALLACAVAVTPFVGSVVRAPRPLYAIGSASGALLIVLAVAAVMSRSRRFARVLPRPARFLLLLVHDLRRVLSRRALRPQLITSAVIVVSIALCFDLIARSLGQGLGLWTCLVVVPPVIVSMHLPMSFAGWGTREVGAVVLLPLAGVPAQTALVISIFYGLLMLASGLIGLAFWQTSPETWQRVQRTERLR